MIGLQKNHIREQLYDSGILPMYSHRDPETSAQILLALYRAGIRVVEFTNRPPEALRIFTELKNYVQDQLPGLLLGAGTILNASQAEAFASRGADFIVAPVTDKEVGAYCTREDLFWCPGAATLTEIVQAQDMGADLVKVFPAEQLGGPAYIRAILAPCPSLRLLPTGGVKAETGELDSWFEAGAKVVGISSHLFTQEIISSGRFEKITQQVEALLSHLRNKKSFYKQKEDHVNP